MSNYQKSEQHIQNANAARLKANAIKEQCPHCECEIPKSSIKRHEKSCIYKEENKKYCLECNSQIFNKENKFCGKSCGASFNMKRRSPEVRARQAINVSKKMKGLKIISPFKGKIKVERIIRKCEACLNTFELQWKTHKKKFCSASCAASAITHKWGKCMSIPYFCKNMNKSVNLQSSWEVKVAEKLDELGIVWTRPIPIPWVDSTGKPRNYFPDFYLPKYNVYLDPKNDRVIERSKEKMDSVKYKIDLRFGSLQSIIDFIINLVSPAEFESAPPGPKPDVPPANTLES